MSDTNTPEKTTENDNAAALAAASGTSPAGGGDIQSAIAAAVAEALKPVMQRVDALKEAGAKQDQANQQASQRVTYLAQKMRDVPAVYHAQLGNDPAKFVEQEQAIRQQFKADLEAAGITAPNVGSEGSNLETKIMNAVDFAKETAHESIMRGLPTAHAESPVAVTAPVATGTGTSKPEPDQHR